MLVANFKTNKIEEHTEKEVWENIEYLIPQELYIQWKKHPNLERYNIEKYEACRKK